jgi:cytochrome b
MQEVKTWDLLVRVLHWSLIGLVVGAWITREGGEDLPHQLLGYGALAIVVVRVIWGFIGSPRARFSDFMRSPATTVNYLRAVVGNREPRHIGHNPLGGWMILILLATIAGVCISGWLYSTDAFWGVAWVGELHEGLTNFLIVLVALHVVGVVFTSFRQRENLVTAMVTGWKRAPDGAAPAPGDKARAPAPKGASLPG